ncbi:MAG: rod shape-determining protein MreC [Gaiellaceae bacterium]
MPRNRTVRLAVLGSSVQRAAAPKYPSRSGTALKRRLVVGFLVLLSLMLITIYFRETPSGGLHSLQGAGATVLRPFQVGAERVARPFRDVYGYFSGLANAKSENARLEREVVALRQQLIQNETARQENLQLRGLLDYRAAAAYPDGFDPVYAAVLAHAPTQFAQHITISAGSDDGIAVDDPVVDGEGLVGRVVALTRVTAKVMLLTDAESAVSALDIDPNSGAAGVIQSGRAGSDSLVLDRVGKDDIVNRGDRIVTSGSQRGALPSLYPRGIPVGEVTFVGQSDIDLYKRIQVDPYVDFDHLDSVIVLVPKAARP